MQSAKLSFSAIIELKSKNYSTVLKMHSVYIYNNIYSNKNTPLMKMLSVHLLIFYY